MLSKLLSLRRFVRTLERIAVSLEQLVRIEALRMQHETGKSALFMLEGTKSHTDESSISTPDYSYIGKYQSATQVLREQLGREPSEEEVQELLEGTIQSDAVPS